MSKRMHQSAGKSPTKASILWADIPHWVRIITPYHKEFVDDLKADVSPGHRKWDPEQKHWMVHESYLEEVVKLLDIYFDAIESDLEAPTTSDAGGDSYSTMYLLSTAPDMVIKKMYRILSNEFHPDKGGSTEQMTRLNVAYAKIKQERKL